MEADHGQGNSALLVVRLGIVLLCIIADVVARWMGAGRRRPGDRLLLEMNLDAFYPEAPADSPLARLLSTPSSALAELTATIDHPARDEAVPGLLARVGSSPLGIARA